MKLLRMLFSIVFGMMLIFDYCDYDYAKNFIITCYSIVINYILIASIMV